MPKILHGETLTPLMTRQHPYTPCLETYHITLISCMIIMTFEQIRLIQPNHTQLSVMKVPLMRENLSFH